MVTNTGTLSMKTQIENLTLIYRQKVNIKKFKIKLINENIVLNKNVLLIMIFQ